MIVRKATAADIPAIMTVLEAARDIIYLPNGAPRLAYQRVM